MSDIDPEKLEKAIAYYGDDARENEGAPKLGLIIKAARAHLATLPRFKEVEITQWVSIDQTGEVHGCWDHESQARDSVGLNDKLSIVRLTGTAKVKVNP